VRPRAPTTDEGEPCQDDRGEEVADGARAKLLHQEQDGDDAACEADDERCARSGGRLGGQSEETCGPLQG